MKEIPQFISSNPPAAEKQPHLPMKNNFVDGGVTYFTAWASQFPICKPTILRASSGEYSAGMNATLITHSLMYSDALTTRLLEYLCEPGTPCFYKFKNRSAMMTVLDLGCGPQLRWAVTAAHLWPNAKVIGIDCICPNPDVQIPSNVEFLEGNL
jgi:hypothetical protein